jgi:hypothetical protein
VVCEECLAEHDPDLMQVHTGIHAHQEMAWLVFYGEEWTTGRWLTNEQIKAKLATFLWETCDVEPSRVHKLADDILRHPSELADEHALARRHAAGVALQ